MHRDLKPANVMLLPDGVVKILDFGLAKASDLTLTGSWARLGTIAYMAPEQIHGHKVDRRADLWALGVVLYEVVTGSRPFGGGHEIGIAHAILYELPPRASALRDEIPSELDDLIDRSCGRTRRNAFNPPKSWRWHSRGFGSTRARVLAEASAGESADQAPYPHGGRP